MSEASAAPRPAEHKLDDLMLAMDVVDTIRHDQRLAERELSLQLSDDALIGRLRKIYSDQGIDVSDAILQEGVKALRERRFAYASPKPGVPRSLALAWVNRARFGRALAVFLISVAALAGGYYLAVERPQKLAQTEISERLPQSLKSAYSQALNESRIAAARERAQQLLANGEAALARGDAEGTRKAIAETTALLSTLREEYKLRVVSRPTSAVWRRPRINPLARNYYLIVEAVDENGRVLAKTIRSEETGETATVEKWGVRVGEDVYKKIMADKLDDGIIQQSVIGEKKRGYLEPDYTTPVTSGAITQW
ncbi:DUF6384 family protein [Methylocystis echinoides]|uniref:DUF6384 family protein n=1 Tax=Methylocystis echinoides TaxID=29468 RepID=UPI003416BB54